MKQHSLRGLLMLPVCVVGLSLASGLALAEDETSPVRLDPEKMAGIGLTPGSSAAFSDILVAGE